MATRFYLPSTGTTPDVTPTPRGWSGYGSAGAAQEMDVTKSGSSQAYTQVYCDSTSGGRFQMSRQLVSKPLASQTISGTLTASIKCYENNNNANATLAIGVYLVDNSGTYKSTLCNPNAATDSASSPREFTTTAGSRRLYNSSETLGVTLSSQSASEGDYLVAEIGFRESTTTTTYYTRIYFGDNESTDLSYSDGDTGVENGWIEFSGDISFYTPAEPIAGTADISSTVTGEMTRLVLLQGSITGSSSPNLLPLNVANGSESGTLPTMLWGTDTTVTSSTANPYAGSRHFRCVFDGDNWENGWVEFGDVTDNLVPITGSLAYTISYYEDSSGAYSHIIGLYFFDSSKDFIQENYTSYTSSTSYTRRTYTYTAPSNAAYAMMWVYPNVNTAMTDDIDYVQFEQGSSATTYQDPGSTGGIVATVTGELTEIVIEPLAGTSDIASTAVADKVSRVRNLAGTCDIASTSVADKVSATRKMAGTADVLATAVADKVSRTRPVAGTSDIASTVTGELTEQITEFLAGTSTIQSTAVADKVSVTRKVAGTADAVATVTGELTEFTFLAGTSDAVATAVADKVSRTRPVAGTSDGSVSTSSELTKYRWLAGTSDIGTTVVGEITEVRPEVTLAGTCDIVSTSVANKVSATRKIAGTSDSATTVTGELTEFTFLEGTSTIQSTAVADKVSRTLLVAGTSDATVETSSALTKYRQLATTIGTQSTSVAEKVSLTRPLAGTSTSEATTAGFVKVAKPMATTIEASSTTASWLTRGPGLSGVAHNEATVTGALSTTLKMVATSDGVATTTSTLSRTRKIAGTSDAVTTTSADISTGAGFGGTIQCSATTAGAMSVAKPMATTIGASATTAGAIGATKKLAVVSGASSTVSGELTERITEFLAGTITAGSTVTGELTEFTFLEGTSTIQSSVTGELTEFTYLAGTSSTLCAVSSELTKYRNLLATSTAQSTTTAHLSSTKSLASTSTAQSTAEAYLTVIRPGTYLVGYIDIQSDVNSQKVSLRRPMAGVSQSVSTTSATATRIRHVGGYIINICSAGAQLTATFGLKGVAESYLTASAHAGIVRSFLGEIEAYSTALANKVSLSFGYKSIRLNYILKTSRVSTQIKTPSVGHEIKQPSVEPQIKTPSVGHEIKQPSVEHELK